MIVAIIFAVILLCLGYGVLIYNQLIKNRNLMQEGWSGIDVQLKRRSDLIPNLIQAVKGYMGHEKGVLERVTELRTQAAQATDPAQRAVVEKQLSSALANIFAVAENYPDLKASQNFIDLQQNLSQIEDQIQLARRYYNGAARNLNISIESFPSNVIANQFKFTKAIYFELDKPEEREVPKVSF